VKVTIDISDRELLDLDNAVVARRMELNKKSKQLHDKQFELLKKGNVSGSKDCQKKVANINEEIELLNRVIERLYEAAHASHQFNLNADG